MLMNLFYNLLFAHVVSDFYLQWDGVCKNKTEFDVKGYGLWFHSAVVGLISWTVAWDYSAWWLALLIMVSHFLIDWLKSWVTRRLKGKQGLCILVLDQLMHIGILYLLVLLWSIYNSGWTQFNWISQCALEHPLRMGTVLALLIVLKPANILILNILDACKVNTNLNDEPEEHGNFRSGELIGWLERGLMLVFVVMGQYEAIGFLIAGKSILRFGETSKDGEKSEYVLTGTLLSLTIALGFGLLVNSLV